MKIGRLAMAIGAALAFGQVGACGGDDHGENAIPECIEIVEACHEVDPGSGPIHECHENAEDPATTKAECMAASANCLMICNAARPDAGI